MKGVICLAAIWLMSSVTLSAQTGRWLTGMHQKQVEKQAVEKVNRFQTNCKEIGSTRRTFQEKTREKGLIEIALFDFMPDARIEITNFDGTVQPKKTIEQYLKRLALLARDRYREIWIRSFQCGVARRFVKDANAGMYVGYVEVVQTFTADTKEGYRVSDKVKRHVKVYARQVRRLVNDKTVISWDIKLGDIDATTID